MCVTGLTTVDTAYWSPFGQVVIMGLIQVGGFGIMTLATLLGCWWAAGSASSPRSSPRRRRTR